ncbi:MAG TPA: MFS transporter [Tahibacter sp.]|uniref:MFS transporter n=1 Tax=Tahibacter sp. TaxID=2056211 RepID=UPI002C88C745|nr:MFS transporter [Tahibacter sp.]HSX60187.1 MFS transporter [Tahibacter sp.]
MSQKATARERPPLTFWQIWNLCFGFLGIQFGFALQNANVSRIFQTLGAPLDDVPLLWIAAPLTGLVVQPIVGYLSDRTWTRLGRRRPYFLVGAVLASLALFAMPHSPVLWVAAGLLWVLDASINIAMEPFRAFVGDQLPSRQRARGYALQSFFIGLGAVVASALPWLLTRAGVANTAAAGVVPDAVRFAFYAGGAVLLLAVGWTVLRTRERPIDELVATDTAPAEPASLPPLMPARRNAAIALLAGIAGALAVIHYALDRQLLLLCGGLALYGLAQLAFAGRERGGMLAQILADANGMPAAMRRLAVVQFFSWFALFAMWIYTTPAVARHHFGAGDAQSAAYNAGADWVGVLFAAYNGFSMLAALVIAPLARRYGAHATHMGNLALGALGLASIAIVRDPNLLLVCMIGVGFAWASILSLPYALLADSLPARKMGVYMGIFNIFIVLPQLVAATVLGFLLKTFFGNDPLHALNLGAASLLLAAACMLRVRAVPANAAVTP